MCNGYSSIVALLQFYSISACIHLERPFLPILLLEEPCSSVRSLVTYFTPFACAIDQQLWIWGRASTGACVTRPGREGRYQAGPKGCSLEVGARRAPRLLVYTYILSRFLGSLTALFVCCASYMHCVSCPELHWFCHGDLELPLQRGFLFICSSLLRIFIGCSTACSEGGVKIFKMLFCLQN